MLIACSKRSTPMSGPDNQLTAEDLGLHLDHMRLSLDPERGVARLVIHRPGKLNAVTMPMRDQFADLFRALQRDDRTRVVIIRGAGEQAFTAGGEVASLMEKGTAHLARLHENVDAPERVD